MDTKLEVHKELVLKVCFKNVQKVDVWRISLFINFQNSKVMYKYNSRFSDHPHNKYKYPV